MGREEGLQHLFVLGIAAFLVIAPIYMVQPAALEYSLIALGIAFAMIDLVVAAALRRPRA
jgi:hypothetical protein